MPDCLAVVLSRTFLDEFYTKIIQEERLKKIVDLDLNNSDLLTDVKPNALCKWTRERERERERETCVGLAATLLTTF